MAVTAFHLTYLGTAGALALVLRGDVQYIIKVHHFGSK